MISFVAGVAWMAQAACRTVDPDLFFPEDDATDFQVQEAKRVCSGCPVRQECLNRGLAAEDQVGICGGMTAEERQRLLSGAGGLSRFQADRADGRAGRIVAVQSGAEMLLWLARDGMTVPEVADRLETSARSVYHAWRLLVPASLPRSRQATALERLLDSSPRRLLEMDRVGLSHQEIADVLGTSRRVVSAGLRVLVQRDRALDVLAGCGVADPVARLQGCELRVKQESGLGLSIDDVIVVAGERIRRARAAGVTLRDLADELGFNRETVRRAHLKMTAAVGCADELTRNEMERVA